VHHLVITERGLIALRHPLVLGFQILTRVCYYSCTRRGGKQQSESERHPQNYSPKRTLEVPSCVSCKAMRLFSYNSLVWRELSLKKAVLTLTICLWGPGATKVVRSAAYGSEWTTIGQTHESTASCSFESLITCKQPSLAIFRPYSQLNGTTELPWNSKMWGEVSI
jgi:hypothetical protein